MVKLFIAIAVIMACSAVMFARQEPSIEGSWATDSYRMSGGAQHPVKGTLFFSGRDWTVLFFVLGENGQPLRGSAEGGAYQLEGDRLVFKHMHHLSAGRAMEGLPESPLKMELHGAAEASSEECRIELSQNRLIIHFPSGNTMTFQRR